MRRTEFGPEAQQNTQLNEEQLNEIAEHVFMCAMMTRKGDVYDYLEAKTSSKRVAIITAMYLGYRAQEG